MKQKQSVTSVPFPIGAKLVLIITILLLVSLGTVIFMVSILSTKDMQRNAEETNFSMNMRAGSQAESSLTGIRESVLFYLEMLERLPAAAHESEMEDYFYNRNSNIAAIGVLGSGTGGINANYINNKYLQSNNIEAGDIEAYFSSDFASVPETISLYNASPVFQISLLAAVITHNGQAGNERIVILFSPDDIFESLGSGTNTSFLISSSGSLLFHPDAYLVLGGENFSSIPIVAAMQHEGDNNRQVSYAHEGVKYFGAYYRLKGIDAVMITTIPHDIVFEAVRGLTRQNIFLTLVVSFIAIVFIWFFSKTISSPVKMLAAAALKIEEGDFTFSLKPKTHDELGLLTKSFDKMCIALNNFGRFTNKEIAIKSMRGELEPGGLPKHATIFFSDIRSFTKKSEDFTRAYGDDAPNRIVLWLNDYLSRMIPCVAKTGGVVDKFIGDGLMAHWGTISTSGSPEEDAYNCVKAALMMRETLIELNAGRLKNEAGNPTINIGCGINTGMVIAGQIGSVERMEYTVIGDPVNLTSRIEALNKPFGTDILITENTWKLAGNKFITEEMLPVTVKGIEKPVRLFAVINEKGSQGPQTLDQVRKLLGIAAPDNNSQNADLEESKFNIQDRRLIFDRRTVERRDTVPEVDAVPAISPDQANVVNSNAVICMTSFGSSASVKGEAGKLVPVFFSWNVAKGYKGIQVIVEVSDDHGFINIIEEREVYGSLSITIPLKPGSYWWRVYPANQPISAACSGTLTVEANAKERIKVNRR